VRRVEPLTPDLAGETLDELASDFRISAVKIGMLATAEMVRCVAEFLDEASIEHSVLDPVLASSSGTPLLSEDGVVTLRELLLPRCTVVTPNLGEAAMLTGLSVETVEEMKAAAHRLHHLGSRNVVVTGGHLREPVDVLSSKLGAEAVQREFPSEHIYSKSTHGTGCAFSSALAANLALGVPIQEAVARSQRYVREAIAQGVPVGHGTGPINRFPKLT
jgi:hydroxymethylpyrimidine/phosphomethylpyrimidine kinase